MLLYVSQDDMLDAELTPEGLEVSNEQDSTLIFFKEESKTGLESDAFSTELAFCGEYAV